jgi:hypothetical protein
MSEVLAWLNRSLVVIAQANSNTKLASKWCLLTTIVSANPNSSSQDIAKVLGVQHHNMSNAMYRHSTTIYVGLMLWTLQTMVAHKKLKM